ncbi:MAG: hypothetical protein RR818_07045, partial [Citrobacter sp.]
FVTASHSFNEQNHGFAFLRMRIVIIIYLKVECLFAFWQQPSYFLHEYFTYRSQTERHAGF